MKSIINIGTAKGNIIAARIDKPFDQVTFTDVQQLAKEHFGELVRIHGWCNMTTPFDIKRDGTGI